MVLQNYKKIIEMTANMIYIVALGVGLKCLPKVHLNTQWGGGGYKNLPKLVMDSSKKTKCHVITFHCKDVIPPLNGL